MQLTGHYDLISHSPLNSQQMSPPLEMTFFFPFLSRVGFLLGEGPVGNSGPFLDTFCSHISEQVTCVHHDTGGLRRPH